MALDIQPLSANRRAIMLVAMLAIFGGSLAFARYLVSSRTHPWLLSIDLQPYGFDRPLEDADSPNVLLSTAGTVDGMARRVDILKFPFMTSDDPGQELQAASSLFERVMNIKPSGISNGTVAGRPAVQVVGGLQRTREHPAIVGILRMMVDHGHAVAICYRGVAPYTDADKKTFDAICEKGISLQS